MAHRVKGMDARSVSEILADARLFQERHGAQVLDAAARWLGDRFAARAGATAAGRHRPLVVH